ncbi:MAG: YDG domain-containing protein, partial [Oscillospiraceae bacterium]
PEQTQTNGTQTTLPEQTQTNGTQTTLPEQTQSEETPSIMAPPVEINTIDGFNYVNPYQVYPIPFNQLYSVNSQYQQFQDTGKYYYILSDEEKAIYDSLETKIATTAVGAEIESNTFSITGDPEIMATNICTAFMMDYPELFWLQEYLYYMPLTNYSISLGTYSNVDPYPFVPYDSLIGASIEADNNAIQAKVSEILSGTTGMTNYEKVCHFNSWLTKNNKYNPIVANSDTISSATHPKGKIPWTIQSAFLSETNKVADNLADAAPVCEAYSEAMKVLCDKVGIPCILATGNVHQWNYVQLDGEWYGVDSTWNDPPFAAGSDNNLVTDYLDSNNNPLVPVSPNDTILNKDCDGTTEYLLKGTTNFEYIDPDSTQNEHIREDESKNLVLIDTDYSSLPAQPITVDQTYKEIYANGLPITIEAGTATNTTKIKYNDGTDKYVVLSGSDITEVDLIDYIIYGGSKDNSVESTSIAMTGGSVGGIYGGGQETTATVTGNTSITISTGAEVYGDVYGGGFKGTVTGTTNVIIDGGKIFSYVYQNSVYGGDVYGGGQETTATVGNGTNVTLNIGTVNCNIYGGGLDGNVTGDTNVKINGGTVSSFENNGAIYGGNVYGGGFNATVTGNTNIIISDGEIIGSVYGGGWTETATVSGKTNLTINSGKTLTLNKGQSLTVSGTLTNNGTIIINGGTIDGTGTLAGTGKIVVQYSAIDIPDITEQLYTGKALTPIAGNTYTAKKTILDKEISTVFTVTYSPAIVKDVGDYKATLTNTDDNKNVITKTFSVVKVGTDFTGGVTVSKNNPTYGEDITISVTPTIGSKKAGLMLANMDAQTANTVALYLKNTDSTYTLISEEKAVTSGTQVDFTLKTTDKKLKIGANTVVVKYKGTANMADQSAEVIITVTAKQLTWNNNGAVNDKIYDGTANATVKTAPTLVGVSNGDNVSVKAGTVNFATSTAGSNIKVTATGYGIEGADIGYYIDPTTQPKFANANITKSKPTIEVKNFTDKIFDAKAIALTAEQITVTGASYSDVKYNYYADNGGTKGGKLDSAPINAGTYW